MRNIIAHHRFFPGNLTDFRHFIYIVYILLLIFKIRFYNERAKVSNKFVLYNFLDNKIFDSFFIH